MCSHRSYSYFTDIGVSTLQASFIAACGIEPVQTGQRFILNDNPNY
ncbi:hypothetical protein ACQE32_07135 [Pantoea sp. FN0302]